METLFDKLAEENAEASKEAKRILTQYPDWKRRYQNLEPSLKSPSFSDMPRGGAEKNYRTELRIELSKELDDIRDGVEKVISMSPPLYSLLHYRYIETENKLSQFEYEEEAGYEQSRYYELLEAAYRMFAEVYKGGEIYSQVGEKIVETTGETSGKAP